MAESKSKEIKGFLNQVTTLSTECRKWIDVGLLQLINFNHDQAILDFQKALTFDNCPMAHYLIAYSNAGHYNNLDGVDYAQGYEESKKALSLTKDVALSDWEVGLIEAQIHRFCYPIGSVKTAILNKNYANAMRNVYQKFGEAIIEVALFFAESLMNLAPWQLWTPYPDYKAAIPETLELVSVFEKALKLYPTHPGLCHLYIHTMELSKTPGVALEYANVLRTQIKDHGHLMHMASHIDMWVGHYKEAAEINELAILTDQKYISEGGVENNFYKMYRMHNFHFLVWSLMFSGQFAKALQSAEAMSASIDKEAINCMLGTLPIGIIFLEPMKCSPWEVLVRFGRWEDILKRPIEQDKEFYPTLTAITRYARAVAFAALYKIEDAEKERELFYESLKDKSLAKRRMMNNFMYDAEQPGKGVLDIAEAIINGEIEYRKKNFKQAFEHLRLAVKRDANLIYGEPWSWLMPTRHTLGALLLENGHAIEAETVYREDLIQYTNNMWSLMGLYQALKAQNKLEEAEENFKLYQQASSFADVKIGASCLCATKMSA